MCMKQKYSTCDILYYNTLIAGVRAALSMWITITHLVIVWVHGKYDHLHGEHDIPCTYNVLCKWSLIVLCIMLSYMWSNFILFYAWILQVHGLRTIGLSHSHPCPYHISAALYQYLLNGLIQRSTTIHMKNKNTAIKSKSLSNFFVQLCYM